MYVGGWVFVKNNDGGIVILVRFSHVFLSGLLYSF